MGFFNSTPSESQTTVANSSEPKREVFLDLNKNDGMLNLQKNDFLNLTKTGVSLNNMRVSAGWDVRTFGSDYDLDLCAYLIRDNGQLSQTVFYGNMQAQGIRLDKDNLTGKGDGDDENIFINFSEINANVSRIVFGVVIYNAKIRFQSFGKVKNAYVRMVDQSTNPEREICRYSLSDDGGKNTAVKFAELVKINDEWTFNAIGEYSKDNINSLGRAI